MPAPRLDRRFGDRILRHRIQMPQESKSATAVLALVALWGCAPGTAEDTRIAPGEGPAVAQPTAQVASAAGSGMYSVDQAARGRAAFGDTCKECHASSEFRGRAFEFSWRRRTAWDFYREVRRTMPEDFPGGLSPQTYVDIIAYVLEINDYSPGGPELSPSEESLRTVPLGPGANKGG